MTRHKFSFKQWSAGRLNVSSGCQTTCSRTLLVPGATAECSGSAKSTNDCASLCHKGDQDFFVVSDNDETVSIKYDGSTVTSYSISKAVVCVKKRSQYTCYKKFSLIARCHLCEALFG